MYPWHIKDRRLRIPSKSIYNVKEQERNSPPAQKATGCELPRARFYASLGRLSNTKMQNHLLYSKSLKKTTKPSLLGAELGPQKQACFMGPGEASESGQNR